MKLIRFSARSPCDANALVIVLWSPLPAIREAPIRPAFRCDCNDSVVVAFPAKVNIVSLATTLEFGVTTDTFHLSTFLPYRLAVLSERLSRRLSVEYASSHGLTVAEWRVLVHLQRCGKVSVRDIHNCVSLEKPRVSRAVSRLESAGLVEKVAGAGDGRLVAISLTAAGSAALADILPKAIGFDQRLRDAVSGQDLETFCRVMERMHAALDRDPAAKPRSRRDLEGLDP